MKFLISALAPALLLAPSPADPVVILDTSMGKIEIELNPEKAPITVKNFLSYVEKKHYDGTVFHRVIPDFMIQGGGLDKDLNEKKCDDPIRNEAKNGLRNNRGTIAMARTNEIDSATSQFFINHKDNDFLNHAGDQNFGYCVFGKVVAGMDVVDKIAAVKTGSRGGHENVPLEPVVINSARLKEEKKDK